MKIVHVLAHQTNRSAQWFLATPRRAGAAALLLAIAVMCVPTIPVGLGGVSAGYQAPLPSSPAPAGMISRSDEALAIVAAYNAASITAGLQGRPDILATFLDPDGVAWRQIQVEFARRAQNAEIHDSTLVRWGILRHSLADSTARIETQEQWDVVVRVGSTVVNSQHGILTRNQYSLRRTSAGGWQITEITSTVLVA